ncbi:MAG TPA: flagellar FlbD family protein [Acidimicrobiales bacterium]|nr:flagellar FlbD family protein [Acidimicrobiales bacterium]
MILVTRLNGGGLAVNADQILRVEATPDTIISFLDGTKLLVTESVEEVIDRVRLFRASVVAAAEELRARPGGPELRLVGRDESGD